MYNAVGTGMQKLLDLEKKDCRVSGDKKGEIIATLGQGLLNCCMELVQSAQQGEHQSEKSKGEKDDEQARVEEEKCIAKNIFGNCLKFFEG